MPSVSVYTLAQVWAGVKFGRLAETPGLIFKTKQGVVLGAGVLPVGGLLVIIQQLKKLASLLSLRDDFQTK